MNHTVQTYLPNNKTKSDKGINSALNKRKNSNYLFSSNKVIEKYIEGKLKDNEVEFKKRFSLDVEFNKSKQTTNWNVTEGRKTEVETTKKPSCDAMTTLSSKSSNGNNQFKRIGSNKSFHTKHTSLQNCPSPINWSNETAKIFYDEETSPMNKEVTVKRLNEIKTSLIELINQTRDKNFVIKEIEGIYKKCIASSTENEENLLNHMLGVADNLNGTNVTNNESNHSYYEALKKENINLKTKLKGLTEEVQKLKQEKENMLYSKLIKRNQVDAVENKSSCLTQVTNFSYLQNYSNVPEILDLSDSYDGLLPDDKNYRKKTKSGKALIKTKGNLPKSSIRSTNSIVKPLTISQTPKKNLIPKDTAVKLFRNKSHCGINSILNGWNNEKMGKEEENSYENYVQLTLDDEGNEVEVKSKNKGESSS